MWEPATSRGTAAFPFQSAKMWESFVWTEGGKTHTQTTCASLPHLPVNLAGSEPGSPRARICFHLRTFKLKIPRTEPGTFRGPSACLAAGLQPFPKGAHLL